MTVITAMLLLLQPVHLFNSSLSWSACLPGGLLHNLFRYLFCFRTCLAVFRSHTGMRSHEPLKHDTPRRDSCCHARAISILSSPVRLA